MRTASVLIAASLLLVSVAALPGVEAARDPVGDCGSGALVQVCPIPCLVPPCPVMVCIDHNAALYLRC
ncbi:MAG: hypothetical protein ACPGQL_07860 [Thermoplasmatota archaeon]